MKKYHMIIIVGLIVSCMFIFGVFGIFLITHMSGMDSLPDGDYMESYESPNGKYVLNSYLCSGNATTDFSVRCEVVKKETGEKRNIYWQYHCENADIKWIDNKTVNINNQTLDVTKDTYDWRNYT